MVLSDALVEEIFQTLILLPFKTVEQLVGRMRAEVAIQQQALRPRESETGMTVSESIESARDRFHRADAFRGRTVSGSEL